MNSFEIEHLQDEIGEWQEYNFPAKTPFDNAISTLGLVEEVGEMCRSIVKMEQGIRGTREEWMEDLKKELGDVFIKLCDVSNRYDVNLSNAIHDRWQNVRKRDWQKDKIGHGV